MSHLPTDAKARKALPLYTGLVKYFPDALVAVAELSRIGNDQHNPGKEMFWDRSKSGDEHDTLLRHLFEAGTLDTDGARHSTKVAWRALAALQKEIEKDRGLVMTAVGLRGTGFVDDTAGPPGLTPHEHEQAIREMHDHMNVARNYK